MDTQDTPVLFRIERGGAMAEELAALTAVLLARWQEVAGATAGDRAPGSRRRAVAAWCRPHRAHRSPAPRSWRSDTS